ncbi:Protein btn1 [Trichinella spiralis]|uniref:Protein btn1 n=1 Tax=Trichinella spiralis TaxID=6334 RepID=A0ABR3K3H7_TRISP
MEFAQLQADLLSPTDGLSFEESGEEKSGETTRKDSRSGKRRERDRVTSSAAALVTSVQRVCPFCEGDHDATVCQRFLNADYSARISLSRETNPSRCKQDRKSGVMANSNQHIRGSFFPWPCELLPLICEIVCEHSKTPAPSYGTGTSIQLVE